MASENKVSIHIHDDLAFSILSKLPLKSLKRFTSTCKSWSLLFENPNFMKMFRNHFISKDYPFYENTNLLLHQRTQRTNKEILHMISGERFNFEDRVKLDWPRPFQEDPSCIEILGSCSVNGILCLYRGYGDTEIVLWNPTTGEFKVIPPSYQPFKNIKLIHSHPLGFGYDRIQDDYKVIRTARYPLDFGQHLFYLPKKDDPYWVNSVYGLDDAYFCGHYVDGMYAPFWEIYSLRSNSWRKLDSVDIPLPWSSTSEVHLNGMCHWFGLQRDIVSFDFSNEMFFRTPIPSSDMIYDRAEKRLASLNGYVALICDYLLMHNIHIWILGDIGVKESWAKLFVVEPLTRVMRPIRVGKKGNIFFRKKADEVDWFDLITQRNKVTGIEGESACLQIVLYKQNFCSLSLNHSSKRCIVNDYGYYGYYGY